MTTYIAVGKIIVHNVVRGFKLYNLITGEYSIVSQEEMVKLTEMEEFIAGIRVFHKQLKAHEYICKYRNDYKILPLMDEVDIDGVPVNGCKYYHAIQTIGGSNNYSFRVINANEEESIITYDEAKDMYLNGRIQHVYKNKGVLLTRRYCLPHGIRV